MLSNSLHTCTLIAIAIVLVVLLSEHCTHADSNSVHSDGNPQKIMDLIRRRLSSQQETSAGMTMDQLNLHLDFGLGSLIVLQCSESHSVLSTHPASFPITFRNNVELAGLDPSNLAFRFHEVDGKWKLTFNVDGKTWTLNGLKETAGHCKATIGDLSESNRILLGTLNKDKKLVFQQDTSLQDVDRPVAAKSHQGTGGKTDSNSRGGSASNGKTASNSHQGRQSSSVVSPQAAAGKTISNSHQGGQSTSPQVEQSPEQSLPPNPRTHLKNVVAAELCPSSDELQRQYATNKNDEIVFAFFKINAHQWSQPNCQNTWPSEELVLVERWNENGVGDLTSWWWMTRAWGELDRSDLDGSRPHDSDYIRSVKRSLKLTGFKGFCCRSARCSEINNHHGRPRVDFAKMESGMPGAASNSNERQKPASVVCCQCYEENALSKERKESWKQMLAREKERKKALASATESELNNGGYSGATQGGFH